VPRVPQQFDPHEMALRGRIGAYRQHARNDTRETIRAGRAAFLNRFLREVDPDLLLPEEERQRRAQHALKAHMADLARRSAQVRRSRKSAESRGRS
jgi:hypothetical protein